MRRAGRDRISLRLPAEPTSVALARNAARGLLHHHNGSADATARLASISAELAEAGLSRCRPRDRLVIHYDVTPAEIIVTVEVRRRIRWQSGASYRRSLTMTSP